MAMVAGQAMAACVAPPTGLVAWWRGNGDAFDSTGTNDARIVSNVRFAPAVGGDGFLFSGNGDDYVGLPENIFPIPSGGYSGTPFTFEVWFRTASGGVIVGQQSAAPFEETLDGYAPALYVGTNGLLHASFFWSSSPMLVTAAPVNDNQWHHAAVSHEGNVQVLYLDGSEVGRTDFVQEGYSTNYYYQMGTGYTGGWLGAPGGWFPFAGNLDEASLYARALTSAEVASLYAAGMAGKCSQTVLRHRYSFDGPPGSTQILDRVRGAHGTLHFALLSAPYVGGTPDGSGLNGSGQLVLRGGGGFAALPPRLVSRLSSMTIEAWLTWNGPRTSSWQRIFDFGSHNQESGLFRQGTNYLMLSPSRGDNYLPGFEETLVSPQGTQGPTNRLILLGQFLVPEGAPAHYALTYDPPAGSSKLYINGFLVAWTSGAILHPLNRFNDVNNWLGRSQWAPDAFMNGTYDEFRIWDGALSEEQIRQQYVAGPNQDFGVVQPWLSISRDSTGLVISWPAANTSGYRVQRSRAQPPWIWEDTGVTPVLQGNSYIANLPITTEGSVYRLER